MFTLLRYLSISEVRKHWLRHLLTAFAILLGVALFSAIRSASSSLEQSLRDTIDQIAGHAALQVTFVTGGLPESALNDISATEGVAAAAPVIESVVRLSGPAAGDILVLGVDLGADRSLREYTLVNGEAAQDPLALLTQDASILVTKEFADRNRLVEGSQLELNTAVGKKPVTVQGIIQLKGTAKTIGRNIGIMDIYAAQTLFSRGETFDRVDVTLKEGARIEDVLGRLQRSLGPGYRIEPPLRRGRQTESLIQAYGRVLFLCSLLALLIAVFVIFNAFSVSVTQRRAQIGILRALGETQMSIQRMFLMESAVLGLVGSWAGVLAGVWIGHGMMLFMAGVIERTYGLYLEIGPLHVDRLWVGFSLILGLFASITGAFLPSREAARVDPVLALQKGKHESLFDRENRVRRWIGAGLAIACMAAGISPWAQSVVAQSAIFSVLFVSLVLLTPTLSVFLATLLRVPLGRIFGPEGRLAADSLVHSPRRTSATVCALTFSLACVLVMATFSVSIKASLTQWIDSSFNSDILIAPSESLTARAYQFPATIAQELKEVPGVRQVDSLRVVNIPYLDKSPLLMSIEIDQWLQHNRPMLEDGNIVDLPALMVGKNRVLVSENFARNFHVRKGSTIVLDTPAGRQQFEVAGVDVDYSSEVGSLLIDRATYKRLWMDDRVDMFHLMLSPGADAAVVRHKIELRFAATRTMFVLSNAEFHAEANRLVDQFLKLQYVQMMIAVLVAAIGLMNSLIVSISERKREIGVLRALGGENHRLRNAIMLEALCVGFVGTMLGICTGWVLGYYSVSSLNAAFVGWVFPYRFPAAWSFLLFPAVAALCVLSAWYPSYSALRTPIVEALAYE